MGNIRPPKHPVDMGQWYIPEGHYSVSIEFIPPVEGSKDWTMQVHYKRVPDLDTELKDLTG